MALKDLFSDSNEDQAMQARIKGIQAGQEAATNQLTAGYNAAAGDYSKALGLYDDLSALGKSGSSMYGNALGLNGAEGNAAATSAFQTSPGYDFALDQGLTQLERRAAARGMLGSGNTSLDSIAYSQGLANQEYGGWLDRLSGLTDLSNNVAGAQSGILTGRGNLAYNARSTLADLYNTSAIGQGEAKANYLEGRDATGANIFSGIMGGVSLGAKLLGLGG